MKNILSFIVIISMGLLVACGGSNTSSENTRSASETSETGATLTTNFESGESTTGELRIEYTITSANGETLAGTIHWGDNTTSRISGTGEAAHQYRGTGTVSVNVQLDDGSLFRLGQTVVSAVSGSGGSGSKVFNERESFNVQAPRRGGGNLPTQTLRFNASDIVPTSDAEFRVQTFSGDLNSGSEYFTIRVNGRTFKALGTERGIRQCRSTSSSLRFSIPLADLIAERNSHSGEIRIVFDPTSAVDNICGNRGRVDNTFVIATLTFSGN